jgi:hypothetical protein
MPGETYADQVGQREDIADIVSNIAAPDTPLSSMLTKGTRITNMLGSSQVDAYDTQDTSGTLDGQDVGETENAAANRARIYFRAMEVRKYPRVSRRAQSVAVVAGVPDEFARAKAKKTEELKFKIETICLGTQDSFEEDGVTANRTRGLFNWLQPDGTAWTDGVTAPPAGYRTPAASIYSGTLANFSENALQALLTSRAKQTKKGAQELKAFVGEELKVHLSNFVRFDADAPAVQNQVRTFMVDGADRAIVTCVDFYRSDFGTVQIFYDAFMPDTKYGAIVDMNAVQFRPHTNPGVQDLEDRGGGPSAIIDAIFALAMLNPLSHAAIKAT